MTCRRSSSKAQAPRSSTDFNDDASSDNASSDDASSDEASSDDASSDNAFGDDASATGPRLPTPLPSQRAVAHRYLDPLDQVWIETAHRIGLRIARSAEVYASTDGAGTLYIGNADTLDADDCVAQMIFHELCHSLVQGSKSFSQEDWGMDNTSDRDVVLEHACLRTQAALSGAHGLQLLLAPTTDFRAFYDRVHATPLAAVPDAVVPGTTVPSAAVPGTYGDTTGGEPVDDSPDVAPGSQRDDDASIALAREALLRSKQAPWSPHLDLALQATATIATAVARFAPAGPQADRGDRGQSLPSLWNAAVLAPLAARKP